MHSQSIKKLIKDPFGVGVYYLFEKLRTRDGRRILSTNVYKKFAKSINRIKYSKYTEQRTAFLKQFREDNKFKCPDNFMSDGYSTFDEDYFPYTSDVVEAGKKIYEAKGKDPSRLLMPYTIAYFDELLDIPAFYNFAFSAQLINHAAEYLGEYPVLTNIGLVRSDPKDEQNWLESQQLHLDVIDTKVFRVLVYITDVNEENGPFTFYPVSVSNKIKKDKKLKYGSPLRSMGIEDAQLKDYTNEKIIPFSAKSGSVLTVDTCNCFHFGSRAKSESRCILMLSFTSLCLENLRERMDLDLIPHSKPLEPDFIKLVKDREFVPSSQID